MIWPVRDDSKKTITGDGYVIHYHYTDIDLDEPPASYNLSFWLKMFRNITDAMLNEPLRRKDVKKLFINLKTSKGDFVIQMNDRGDSLHRSGDKVYYKY
jgi:hypothetical protein